MPENDALREAVRLTLSLAEGSANHVGALMPNTAAKYLAAIETVRAALQPLIPDDATRQYDDWSVCASCPACGHRFTHTVAIPRLPRP